MPAKAVLVNTATGAALPVLYNPAEFTLEQGNTFAEIGIPGLAASPSQYVRGKLRTLAMELFFDSYETGQDVRRLTAPILALLDPDPRTLAPPVLLFSMGRFQFRCVLADAGQRFTMFVADGTPVRCTMTVRLQEYTEIEIEIQSGLFVDAPGVSAAVDAIARPGTSLVHVVVRGDTVSALAGQYLGDPGRWREIADANAVADPLVLTPGATLVIPGGRRP
jgi:nucleoid-associated protein YgaU